MTASTFTFRATSLDDTDRFGEALARLLPNGITVCLSGTLGAGKTRLVQAIAAACGVNRADVVSPTFVLCQHYSASRQFDHLDAYRIRDDDEFLELGVDEMFASDGITLVEWGERFRNCLPLDRVEIQIQVLGDTEREFRVTSIGDVAPQLCAELQRVVGG
ncbi:MAG: tRNA (adenosine(37)-N6)-threonylcarbamoyltransferase complex ATPase subunit type 1 TsaE [Planctomycetota bacterium]|nr:tRNA (adenosine(37)-N6)-threonylcarbamoyltransferase complex ATPase subunit type 1 TsaE [Planctomycetota bacterium]